MYVWFSSSSSSSPSPPCDSFLLRTCSRRAVPQNRTWGARAQRARGRARGDSNLLRNEWQTQLLRLRSVPKSAGGRSVQRRGATSRGLRAPTKCLGASLKSPTSGGSRRSRASWLWSPQRNPYPSQVAVRAGFTNFKNFSQYTRRFSNYVHRAFWNLKLAKNRSLLFCTCILTALCGTPRLCDGGVALVRVSVLLRRARSTKLLKSRTASLVSKI